MGRILSLLALPPLMVVTARAQEPTVTFRTSVQEVVLDLVVRDKHGRIVKDLKPEQVAVYEDGVRQTLTSFRFVPGRELQPVPSGKAALRAKTQPKAAPARSVELAKPMPAVNLVCIVLHNLGLDPRTTQYTIGAIREFLNNHLEPGTGVAFFSLYDNFTVLHQFTTDRNELLQAASNLFKGVQGRPPTFASVADAMVTAAPFMAQVSVGPSGEASVKMGGGEINPNVILGADIGTDTGEQMQRADLTDQRLHFGELEGMREWDQIMLMINQLGPLPGRKTVLFFSPGLMNVGDADLRHKLLKRANDAQISVYAIDINGLDASYDPVQASSAALRHLAGVSAAQTKPLNSAKEAMVAAQQDVLINDLFSSNGQENLRELAEATGGFLIANSNDLRKPMQRVVQEVDTHYEAIYRPASQQYDGRLRSIEVKLARKDLTVQSRTGYFALPAFKGSGEPSLVEMVGLAALNAPEPPHVFDYQTAAYQFQPTATGSECALAFELPAKDFEARLQPDTDLQRMHLAVVALVKDSHGQVVDTYSQETAYQIPQDKLEAMRQTAIPLTHLVDLPPGHYHVDAAVVDLEANRASVARLDFDNPESKGLGMSSVMLVQSLGPTMGLVDISDPFQYPVSLLLARRVIPELATALPRQAHPFAYLVIYPDKANPEKPKLQVEFLAAGKLVVKRTEDLPAPAATGAIPIVLRAPAVPGNYELRLTALQGSASATKDLTYTVAAN